MRPTLCVFAALTATLDASLSVASYRPPPPPTLVHDVLPGFNSVFSTTLHKYLVTAQKAIQLAITEMAAIHPWVEGQFAGITGDTEDETLRKLDTVHKHAAQIVVSVNEVKPKDFNREAYKLFEKKLSAGDLLPRPEWALPCPTIIQPITRERSLVYLVNVLDTGEEAPIRAAHEALTESFGDSRIVEEWANVIDNIEKLLSFIYSDLNPTSTFRELLDVLNPLGNQIRVEIPGSPVVGDSSLWVPVRLPRRHEAEPLDMAIMASIQSGKRDSQDSRNSMDVVESERSFMEMYDIVADLFRHAAEGLKADSCRITKENLEELRNLVVTAIGLPDDRVIQPVPHVPKSSDSETTGLYLAALQSSLYSSLAARLSIALPSYYPPLYGSDADFLKPEYDERLVERMDAITDVAEFLVNVMDASDEAKKKVAALSKAVGKPAESA